MTSAQENTKVERVVEAIEGLTVAVAANVHGGGDTHGSKFEDVLHAREEVATALREFLQPTLRVVGGRDTLTRNDVVDFTNDPFQFGPPKKQ
jgi:selenocysteine lyase/cysteine desulfurase